MTSLPVLLTITETCDRLRLSRPTVMRAIKRGDLSSVRIGARVFVTEAELARFIAASTSTAGGTR